MIQRRSYNQWILLNVLLNVLLIPNGILCAQTDPLEQFVRSTLLFLRAYAEKALSGITLPRSESLAQNVKYSFQVDEKATNTLRSLYQFIDACPVCQTVPAAMLAGEWQLVMANRNFLMTVIPDLSETIDRIAAGLPITVSKSFSSIFASNPDLQCAQFTIVNRDGSPPFQFEYLSRGKRRSIIGHIVNERNKYVFHFAPTLAVEFCLTMSTVLSSNTNELDALVLSQSDTFPSCSNFLILVKKRQPLSTVSMLEHISRNGGNYPSNPLIDIGCSQLQRSDLASSSVIMPSNQ